MKVVLLAAGRSLRMQPIPDKNFLLFLDKPLISYQINQLTQTGFNDFIIVGGKHNLQNLEKLKQNEEFQNINIQIIEQENLDEGMAGAVMSVKEIIDDEPVCFVSSNDIVDIKAYNLIQESLDEDFESLIVGKKVESYFPGGYLETEKDGTIKGIIEKPGEGNEPSDLVNIVIHCHKHPQKLIDILEKTSTDRDDRYEVALVTLIKEGVKMKALEFDGYWQPIKYPWHVFEIMKYFFENMEGKISKNAKIAKTAVINGKVIIEDGVKVFDHATIIGPCIIGKNAIVASNALVRDSIVNEGSVIGFSTEIARSYLGKNVWTHSNYIGDSVISNNCAFGSGAVTGNLRLDEKEIKVNIKGEKMSSGKNKFGLITGENIRCGINSSFMPGIKIGSNSMIGGGIIINQDIPENSYVKGKAEIEIRENKAALNPEEREKMKKNLG